jgi:hypothetical protein
LTRALRYFPVMARRALLLAALLFTLCAAPSAAQDSIAPPGSDRHWLPHWSWVLNHWFPYSVPQLYAALDTSDAELREYFGGRAHPVVPPLADLARQRGVSPGKLVRELVAPWRHKTSRAHFAALKRRAALTLSQGHLLQHMLFHPLHEKALLWRTQDIFTITPVEVDALLRQGYSRLEIGARYGRSEQDLTDATTTILRRASRRAVRQHWTTRSEADRYLAIQIDAIPAWLTFKAATADPQAQYSRSSTTVGFASRRTGGRSLFGCVGHAVRTRRA